MMTLKCDNRVLTTNSKISYLADNYVSAVSSVVVVNCVSFAANDYIVFGEFGSETTEISQVSTITTATNTLNLVAATKFAHSQDTKISVIKYNQVRFYHTVTAVFSATAPVTAYMDVQADDFYTMGYDSVNTTGFGWFLFYNSTTAKATFPSNPIPYAGFSEYSVKKIFDSFFSLLNNKELRLISNDDAYRWLNEAYTITQNELNLVNTEYAVPTEYALTTVIGTQEYALPADFSDLVSVTDENGYAINFVDLSKSRNRDKTSYSTVGNYYLRADSIGFTPIPTQVGTYYIYYQAKAIVLTSYYDNVNLPDDNFYPLVDHMMYRASIKLGKPNPDAYESEFEKGIQRMKLVSIKRDANLDSWSIGVSQNV